MCVLGFFVGAVNSDINIRVLVKRQEVVCVSWWEGGSAGVL